MNYSIEIIFDYMSINPALVWRNLIEVGSITIHEMAFLYENKMKISNIEKSIIKSGKPHFYVEIKDAVFQYTPVGNYNLSFLIIEKYVSSFKDVYRWVEPFLSYKSFIQARIYDEKYEYWQNAHDPIQFKSSGKDYKHLPMKSNELPPPLEQMVIDTSKNPGRRVLCDGYVEGIGSRMWLSNKFFKITKTSKKNILNQNWIKSKQLNSDIIEIRVDDKAFDSSEGDYGLKQDKLRSLLFINK
jgi:hypothetical protein